MTVAKEKSGKSADNAHDATGGADQLGGPNDVEQSEHDYSGARAETGDQIAKEESDAADGTLERWSEDVEGEQIEKQVDGPVMQEERGAEPPVFMAPDDEVRIKGSKPGESGRIHR